MLFILTAVCSLVLFGHWGEAATYSEAQGLTSLYLSMATFCDPATYQTRAFVGYTEGFVATKTINTTLGAVGFIGYLPSDESIYIAFRGSSSLENWISDFNVQKIAYATFPECECNVTEGWYHAMKSAIDGVVEEVAALRQQFPTYAVRVTGHSYGAAIAQLTSMDLVQRGIPCSVYNFGQPRTGDQKYADFVTSRAEFPELWRVVHYRDIVPHWPFSEHMGFAHACSEEYEDENGVLTSCGRSSSWERPCEDPACSAQFDEPRYWRPDDHMTYLGYYISCETVS